VENYHSIDNEEYLIHQLKNGSYDAFDKIYQLYVKRLYAYCFRFTKSHENSEEIVQDVFVKLWTNRENIKHENTLSPLLFIMVKHNLINAFRAKVNQPVYEEYVDYKEKTSVNDTLWHMEYQEFVAQFRKATQILPPTIQKVVTLSKIHQLSNKEIAEELKLNDQTVRNSLSVGLKKLKEILSRTYLSHILLIVKIIDLFGIN
jgi:RNA polymerase sigma-70 factor (ECF subfamily)